MRKVIVTLADSGAVESVNFIGGHLTKRELERVLRAVKQGRKERIREYRRAQIKKEIENGTN